MTNLVESLELSGPVLIKYCVVPFVGFFTHALKVHVFLFPEDAKALTKQALEDALNLNERLIW